MVKVEPALISVEDFMQLYGDEGPFEWIDGERIPVTPQVTRSSRIAVRLLRRLADHVDARQLGEAFMEAPFVMPTERKSRWLKGSRVPDVMFVRAERLERLAEEYPDWEDMPLPLIPDLVVEIISPSDKFSDVSKKIARYLADGVRLVWLIDPEQRNVIVYEQGSDQHTTLGVDRVLAGGAVIPGFEMPIASLFG